MKLRWVGILALAAAAAAVTVWACGHDGTLRAYLHVSFWEPFAKSARDFERRNVRRISLPYAGMGPVDNSPLGKLRASYRKISQPLQDPTSIYFIPTPGPPKPAAPFERTQEQRTALLAARASQGLSAHDREEIDLIDAKIDMRGNQYDAAVTKLETFLKKAKSPEYLSEARGWLAYVTADQTQAGKIYLDELNRNGSNLSRETLLNSLKLHYEHYEGRTALYQHFEEYFDTPEHASFAIQMLTNPQGAPVKPQPGSPFARMLPLLEQHRELFEKGPASNALALLSMRTALHQGDPAQSLTIANMVPADSTARREPDFLWMLAASHYLTRNYAAAEQPLLQLFRQLRSDDPRKAAAAYALCGVYQKTQQPVEQIHFALWPQTVPGPDDPEIGLGGATVENFGIYWAVSGIDLSLLLDAEASTEALEQFLAKYPKTAEGWRVKYALAVHYARDNRYKESAALFASIHGDARVDLMRQLAAQWDKMQRPGAAADKAKVEFARILVEHPDHIYFNSNLWYGYQNEALYAEHDSRFTAEEREAQVARERQLRDDQEEYWRAYLLLREVVNDAGHTPLGEDAAKLAIRALRKISTRFGRREEIAAADIELTKWLRSR